MSLGCVQAQYVAAAKLRLANRVGVVARLLQQMQTLTQVWRQARAWGQAQGTAKAPLAAATLTVTATAIVMVTAKSAASARVRERMTAMTATVAGLTPEAAEQAVRTLCFQRLEQ